MRQLFSVLFLAFFSFSFSQCEIGKISFALGDFLMFFTNGKVEGENKNERKENKDADVNSNLKENIFITTPMNKKNSSSMSGSSLYSEIYTTAEISTTASQTSQNNVCHNVDGKGVFDCAGNSFFAKRDLISSFKSEQEAGDDSDDKKELLIHNNKEQPKREDSRYLKLIRKKIKEQENQAGTLYLVRGGKGSSIFVPRYAFIGNNKISQEIGNTIYKEVKNSRFGNKKDGHKNVNISGADTNIGVDRIIDQNMNTTVCNDFVNKNVFTQLNSSKEQHRKKTRQSPTHKNNMQIESSYCKVNINNNRKKRKEGRDDSGIKFIRFKRLLVKGGNIGNDSSTCQESKKSDC